MSTASPHLELELSLFAEGFRWVGAVDEVGRGSVFGPCCVGAVVIDSSVRTFPPGLRDSKLLRADSRDALIAPLREWVSDVAVGEASAREIDEFGLTAALRLAGRRALAALTRSPEVIILDGAHDWLSRAEQSLLAPPYPVVEVATVRTRIKADVTCASVAAASVFAKVHRDQLVTDLARGAPGYDIESNKGYATPAHLAALRRLGPSDLHRVSWRLPELSGSGARREKGIK
ncbi:MAG: ribonuclease HII [Acidimicrobiaceae bacterium]|nr:ribonuclease HII [Acidimicrobiaceae bacterium]